VFHDQSSDHLKIEPYDDTSSVDVRHLRSKNFVITRRVSAQAKEVGEEEEGKLEVCRRGTDE
jgi:hypothetical protein